MCFTMFPSCLCCTIWAKYPITRLVSKDLKQRELEKERFTVVCPRCRQNLKTGHFTLLESLSKDDGYGNENVSPKYNLALSQVFRDYSVLFTLYNTGELSCNWMGTNGFKVKIENCYMLTLSSKPKIW